MSPQQVIQKADTLFEQSQRSNVGYSESTWWLRITPGVMSSADQTYVRLVAPLLRSVDAFWIDASGELQQSENGYAVPASDRDIYSSNIIFEMPDASDWNSGRSLYVRIQSRHFIDLDYELLNTSGLYQFLLFDVVLHGSIAAGILLLLIYNLFLMR